MMRYLASTLFALILSDALLAAPPTLTALTPRGVERGKSVEVVVSGANLTPETTLWLPFAAEVKRLADDKPNPAQARFLITADAKTPIGFYLVRLFGPEGVSAATAFAVDPFPGVAEKEDNNTPDKAQAVAMPAVVDGQCAGGDVDFFRFPVKKGQRLVIETEAARLGAGLVPQLRLTDDKGRFLAGDGTQRLQGDARILFTPSADGFLIVELSDSRFRAANPPHYRLKIGDYDVADEVFPMGFQKDHAARFHWRGGNLQEERPWNFLIRREIASIRSPSALRLHPPDAWKEGMAWPEIEMGPHRHVPYREAADARELDLKLPVTFSGRFEKKGDVHRLAMAVRDGQKLRFRLQAETLGSRLDGVIKLLDDKGKLLAQADDVDVPSLVPGQPPFKSADPVLEYTVPAGLRALQVEWRDGLGRGGVNFGYLLTLEDAQSDFLLRLATSEINAPRDGFALVPVIITRRGYDGPIQLDAKDLPPGWQPHAGFVPAKGNAGSLLIQAPQPTPTLSAPVFFTVSGKALDGPASETMAEFRFVLSSQANPAVSAGVLNQVALGLDATAPLRLDAPAQIELVQGLAKSLPVLLSWDKETKTPFPPVEISVAGETGKPTPGGLTVKPASIPAGMLKTDLMLLAPTTLAEGRSKDLVLQAKTKLAGKDVTLVGPALRVQVVRPFELAVEKKHLLTPGENYLLKGTIKRHADFRLPVQLKIEGLPPGVAALPIKPLSAEQDEFAIELKVDAKAASGPREASLSASATIGGMAYAHPAEKLIIEVDKSR